MPSRAAKHGDGPMESIRAKAIEFIDMFDANTMRVMCRNAGASRLKVLSQMRPFLIDVQVLGRTSLRFFFKCASVLKSRSGRSTEETQCPTRNEQGLG
jgi:hypothetical protein